MNSTCTRSSLLAALLLAVGLPFCAHAGDLTPPKIIQTVETRFPSTLEYTAITAGEVGVIISIGADGLLADVLVTDYSHEEFAREAVAALRQWRFEPARQDGQAVAIRMPLKFDFSTPNRVVTLTPLESAAALMRFTGMRTGHHLVCSARELDRPLAVLRTVTPRNPGRALNIAAGRTLVDFYVDESGRPRLPVILETTHSAFADAAIRALGDWQFDVPTRHGRPVIVHLRQEFVFANDS